MQACKSWHAAARKEKSRGVHVAPPLQRLASLLSSPLCYHIAAFSLPGYFDTCTLVQLSELSALPALTSCKVTLSALDPSWTNDFRLDGTEMAVGVNWPARLHTACITLDGEPSGLLSENALAHAQNALVTLIGRRFSTLTNLTLHLRARAPTLNLQPLQAMMSLTSLTLEGIKLSTPQLRSLKQVQSLTYLSSSKEWSEEQLVALCRPPHSLTRLQVLDLSRTRLSVQLACSLVRLPALTSLDSSRCGTSALRWLVRFPHLLRLHLNVPNPDPNVRRFPMSEISPHLRGCNALRHLQISKATFDGESDVSDLAAALPLLESLDLTDVLVSSLSGLRSLRHLCTLSLDGTETFLASLVADLQQLASLRALVVRLPANERLMNTGVRDRILQATQHIHQLTSVTIKEL